MVIIKNKRKISKYEYFLNVINFFAVFIVLVSITTMAAYGLLYLKIQKGDGIDDIILSISFLSALMGGISMMLSIAWYNELTRISQE